MQRTGIWKRREASEGTKELKERKKDWEKYFNVKEREKKDESNNNSADKVWGSCVGQRVEWNKGTKVRQNSKKESIFLRRRQRVMRNWNVIYTY
jgi:hypothetical protein